MAEVKARDPRGKNEELLEQPEDLKLSQQHVAKVTGGAASKLSKIRVVHKPIARALTIINQTREENLRNFHKREQYEPRGCAREGPRRAKPARGKPEAKRRPRRRNGVPRSGPELRRQYNTNGKKSK